MVSTGSHYRWRVVPLSDGQLLDVAPEDVLSEGDFRRCNTYKGGGGYDRFPSLAEQYFGEKAHNLQFVVQLYGCNLDCPYCYVTREGVWNSFKTYSSEYLTSKFVQSGCSVFHLMGGAPALTMRYWPELLSCLDSQRISFLFHSDFMLVEGDYEPSVLSQICHRRSLYAVNIKGVTSETFLKNTRKELNSKRMWRNLELLEEYQVPYYLTFTDLHSDEVELFWSKYEMLFGVKQCESRRLQSFSISLVKYQALQYVDSIPWGGLRG